NTCWPSHGSGAAVTSPEISTRPFQHSGVAGQRAVPPVTSAAGQFAATVATPYTDGGVAASDGGVAALAPAALVAAAAWPAGMLAPLRAGPSEAGPFWPMSTPATTAAAMTAAPSARPAKVRGDRPRWPGERASCSRPCAIW